MTLDRMYDNFKGWQIKVENVEESELESFKRKL